jgi:raffinose/stachyose/melibiose transport system substrate-binding protein
MCPKINAAGKIPVSEGFADFAAGSIVGQTLFGQFVYNIDPKWDAKRARNQVTFASSPLWHRALQAFLDMKNANCFQSGAAGTSRTQQLILLARGDAVMSIAPSTDLPAVQLINPTVKIKMINLPPDDPKNASVYTSASVNLSVNAATKYPAQAKTFVDFVARQQQSTLYAKVGGSIAPFDAKLGMVPAYQAELAPLYKSGKTVSGPHYSWPNVLVFNQGYAPSLLGLITGQTNIDGILASMDQLWNNGG